MIKRSSRRRAGVAFGIAAGTACLSNLVSTSLTQGSTRSSHSIAFSLPSKSFLDEIFSFISTGANVATAASMVYLARKLTTQTSSYRRSASAKSSSFEDAGFEFARQSSVIVPEIGNDVFQVKDPKGRTNVEFQKPSGDTLVIRDSPEALLEMKSVFKRLCTTSKELLSLDDVAKVHKLLGEPVDQEEQDRMVAFFGEKSKHKAVISFEMFMNWWSELHDSSADPDQYYSSERYRERFKVLSSRLKDPKIAAIQTITEGEPTSRRFRVYYEMDGARLSPWHDVPLKNDDGSYNFICEIPKWTRKKYEIATGEQWNPIKQDVKNGVLREYKWGDMLFNYGAFPQTWEDPKHISEETGCPGDNDPIDVIELGTRQRPVGAITRVKIVGVIAMIDDDETDWKILALALDDDKASQVNDLKDLDAHMPGVTASLTHWLRFYKTAEGKAENKFGCGGKPQGHVFAERIVQETHDAWKQLVDTSTKKGKLRKVSSGNNLFTDLALED
jgi:inorganic pyrophosphatase